MKKLAYALILTLAPLFADGSESYCKNIFTSRPDPKFYRDVLIADYINTVHPGKAKDGGFFASFRPATGETSGGNNANNTFDNLEFSVFRNAKIANNNLPEYLLQEDYTADPRRQQKVIHLKNLIQKSQRALQKIYQSFSTQGPERQILVNTVREQDRNDGHRVSHFMVEANNRTIGHAQILVSNSKDEPLHIDDQWGLKTPGQVRGEIGRLYFYRPDVVRVRDKYSPNKWQLAEERYAPFTTHQMSKILLFQKLFSYANHDLNLDSLSFQVNHPVYILLKRMGVPLNLAKDKIVTSNFEGREIREHIVIFEKASMLQAETQFLKRLILMHLENFLSHDPMSSEKMTLRFSRNEFRALLDTGLLGTQKNNLQKALRTESKISSDGPKVIRLQQGTFSITPTTKEISSPIEFAKSFFELPSSHDLKDARFIELVFERDSFYGNKMIELLSATSS